MQRIDAHHHLWHYSEEDYGWIDDSMAALRRDFLLADLRTELASAHVDGTVAVQARQSLEETHWLLGLATADSPVRGVVGWLPLADASFRTLLDKLLPSRALKGLRHVVQGEPEGFLDRDDFNRGLNVLRGTGLVYDLLIYARQLEETLRFVDRHPNQSFVVDHLAKPDIRHGHLAEWARALGELARRPHVTCKLSGMVTEADPLHWTPEALFPYVEVVLEAFGPRRLMIGTDWPVLTVGCTYSQWWSTVEAWTVRLSEPEQAEILGGTATRVYALSPQLGRAPQTAATPHGQAGEHS